MRKSPFLPLVFAVLVSAPLSSLAAHRAALTCTGDLPIFIYKGATAIRVKKSAKGYVFRPEQAPGIGIGRDPKKPYFKVFPWGGIDIEDNRSTYSGDFEISYRSDGNTWFSLLMKMKNSKLTRSLDCRVF